MDDCLSCAREFYFECGHTPPPIIPQVLTSEPNKPGRPLKDDNEITVSAGRKRAASAYIVDPEAPCEWRNLAQCGGGINPIVGCKGGFQKHRHHGPIKNTSHNERTNIHLICPRCHNTWHAKNDPVYNEAKYSELPHDPHEATELDYINWFAAGNKLD